MRSISPSILRHNNKKSLSHYLQSHAKSNTIHLLTYFLQYLMKNQKGFTLVELMVVMAIIAILATAGISQYGKFIKGARDTTRIADLNAINIVLLDAVQSK